MRIVPLSELRSLSADVRERMESAGLGTVHQLALYRSQGFLKERVEHFSNHPKDVDLGLLEAEIDALLTAEELDQIGRQDTDRMRNDAAYGVINPSVKYMRLRDAESQSPEDEKTEEGDE